MEVGPLARFCTLFAAKGHELGQTKADVPAMSRFGDEVTIWCRLCTSCWSTRLSDVNWPFFDEMPRCEKATT